MPDTNVSSCVLNILSSFSGSLGLFKKCRDKRRKKRRARKNDRVEEEELRLSKSLRQGPEDIGREYQKNIYEAGESFAIGDAIAQTSLAEILLRLNVGLVGIITKFVDSDKHDVQLDYQGLTDLSERSRIDTCRALRQLFKRMTQLRLPNPIRRPDVESRPHDTVHESRVSSDRKTKKATAADTKIRGPTIARVVIQNSSKPSQIAIVKPGERRKKSHSSSSSGSSALSKASSDMSLVKSASTPPPEYAVDPPSRPSAQRSKTAPVSLKPRRKHSATNVSNPPLPPRAEGLRATRSTPRLLDTSEIMHEPLPPMPNTAPLPAATSTPALVPRRRKPTPTYYSIASDSTKLGEIPLHKWTTPFDFDQMSIINKQAERNGWPINEFENQEGRRKKTGLFRLFGRRG